MWRSADDQPALRHPQHLRRLAQDELHLARILPPTLRELARCRRGLDGRELDKPALRLRDDLLRDHDDVVLSETDAGVTQRSRDDRPKVVAWMDLGDAVGREQLDAGGHASTPLRSHSSRSSGVSRSKARPGRTTITNAAPAASAASRCAARLPTPNLNAMTPGGRSASPFVPLP